MKFKYILFVLSILLLFSCENAKLKPLDNFVYIYEASQGKVKDVKFKTGVTNTSINVRLARKVNEDVFVNVKLDEDYLNSYNKLAETSYKCIESSNISFPETIKIPSGEIGALPLNLEIQEFDTNGAQYAIPLTVTSVDGKVKNSKTTTSFLITLTKPLKQLVPRLKRNNHAQAAPTDEAWKIMLDEYTLEWWSKMSGFQINNQAIINSGGGDCELYIRFGDAIYRKYNFLQIKTLGSQFDTGDPTKGKGLNANEWIHFAITYTSSDGVSKLYKNGELVASLKTAVGKKMQIDGFQIVSSGTWFRDEVEMCQIRFWKIARTEGQLKQNMYSEVEYTNPALLLYYPMNEGSGQVLKDVTGNGHDMTLGNGSGGALNTPAVAWTEYKFGDN